MKRAVRPVGIAAVVIALATLTSCLSVESHFSFKADGSGQLRLVYRIAGSLARLGGNGSTQLPINEEDFRTAAAAVDGVELIEYRFQDTHDQIEISATLRFDQVERLADVPSLSTLEARLQGGDPATFEQLIATAGAVPVLEAEALDLLRSLLAGHEVRFVVQAPRQIRRHSDGALSDDGRVVELSIPLVNYMLLNERRTLTVEW
jgi:hypothetical protein